MRSIMLLVAAGFLIPTLATSSGYLALPLQVERYGFFLSLEEFLSPSSI